MVAGVTQVVPGEDGHQEGQSSVCPRSPGPGDPLS